MTAYRQDAPTTALLDIIRQATALTVGRDYQPAAEAWRRAVAPAVLAGADPAAQAAAWVGLGDSLRELARWRDAADAFRQAAALPPGRADAWAGLAVALVNLGDPAQGLAAAQAALNADPMLAEGHRAQALAYLRGGLPDEAAGCAAEALRCAPEGAQGRAEALAALALVRMMQNRLEEADALFQQAIDAKPTLAEAVGNHATLLARMGRAHEAQRAAALAIKLKPFLPAPFFLLGNLLRAAGQLAEAVEAFAQTLRIAPDHPDARVNLADSLRQAGRFSAAADICRGGLDRRPDDVRLLINLGAALQSLGDGDGALAAYRRALDIDPNLAEADNNIARLHQAAGRRDEAVAHLRRAAAARPQDAGIARNLSAALLDDGRVEEAEAAARQAVDVGGGDPANHRQLALALARQDRAEAAMAALDAALRLNPDDGESWFQAAVLLIKNGDRAGAVPCCRQALRLSPDEGRCWALLAQALRGLRLQAPDPDLRLLLLRALREPGAEHAYLMDAAVSAVLLEPALAAVRAAAESESEDDFQAYGDTYGQDGGSAVSVMGLLRRADIAGGLADDALLIALLETVIVTDPALERALTALRRAVLLAAAQDGVSAVDHLRWIGLLTALARQCFFNEYIFAETPAETAALATLEAGLHAIVGRGEAPPINRLALYACYRPLAGWEVARRLAIHDTWPACLRSLLALMITEPWEEKIIAEQTPRLTPMDRDPVSREVRAQYEACPYPRWVDAGLLDAPAPVPRLLRAMFPHVILPPDPRWDAPQVLVAGCGAGRESVWVANQAAGAEVLAVDLSLSSLAYAQRQTRRLGVRGVTYAQGDLLELGGIDRRFDMIHSVGVLHHLADPLTGWRVLIGLLRPGGVMKVGFYSAKARTSVVAARAYIAEKGYAPTLDGVRAFRRDALALPAGHPVRVIVDSPDFYNLSACRDLVFHVQEHRMTLPQIAGWIDGLGLEFLGFQLDDLAVGAMYRRRFPEDPTMTSLTSWNRFESENPQIFSGMYQFWVRRPA